MGTHGTLSRGDWECGYKAFHDKVYLSDPKKLSPVVSIVAINAQALEEKLEVYLSYPQALQLLAWLEQERETLERQARPSDG